MGAVHHRSEAVSYRIHNGRTIYHRARWGARVWYPALARLTFRILPRRVALRAFFLLRDFALPVDTSDPRNDEARP
jgi:hypothetical protein